MSAVKARSRGIGRRTFTLLPVNPSSTHHILRGFFGPNNFCHCECHAGGGGGAAISASCFPTPSFSVDTRIGRRPGITSPTLWGVAAIITRRSASSPS